jgi:hypothetical protein
MTQNLANMLSQSANIAVTKPIRGGRTMKKRINKTNITGTHGRGTFLRKWSKLSPGTHERTLMVKRCGKKCFLGPKKTFPICRRGTCKRNKKGIYSAYIRAREYTTIKGSKKYRQIAKTAKKLLNRL